MRLLRTTLRWQAALWAVSGAALAIAPGWVVETLLDQAPLVEDAWLRLLGVSAIALAAQMVLVGHRIEELWWWSWTFTLLQLGTAAVFLLVALTGPSPGASSWPWWTLGLLNAAVALVDLGALAKAGTERSPV